MASLVMRARIPPGREPVAIDAADADGGLLLMKMLPGDAGEGMQPEICNRGDAGREMLTEIC